MTAVLSAFKGRRSKRPEMFVVEALLLFCVAPTCAPSDFTNYLQSIQIEPECSNKTPRCTRNEPHMQLLKSIDPQMGIFSTTIHHFLRRL